MTAKCHPPETVWGEGHAGVPAMGVVRLLGKQQPDKQYRLAPITETAAQATDSFQEAAAWPFGEAIFNLEYEERQWTRLSAAL